MKASVGLLSANEDYCSFCRHPALLCAAAEINKAVCVRLELCALQSERGPRQAPRRLRPKPSREIRSYLSDVSDRDRKVQGDSVCIVAHIMHSVSIRNLLNLLSNPLWPLSDISVAQSSPRLTSLNLASLIAAKPPRVAHLQRGWHATHRQRTPPAHGRREAEKLREKTGANGRELLLFNVRSRCVIGRSVLTLRRNHALKQGLNIEILTHFVVSVKKSLN